MKTERNHKGSGLRLEAFRLERLPQLFNVQGAVTRGIVGLKCLTIYTFGCCVVTNKGKAKHAQACDPKG